MTPEQPVTITLPAQQWHVVLDALGIATMPWRMTNPVIQALATQMQALQDDQPTLLQPGNGTDRHVSN